MAYLPGNDAAVGHYDNENAGVKLQQRLLRAGNKQAADAQELIVDGASQTLHAGNCGKRDQGNDQGIFNQILAFFAARQVLELHVHLEKQIIHFFCPLRKAIFPA
jgi:hypothetical protein